MYFPFYENYEPKEKLENDEIFDIIDTLADYIKDAVDGLSKKIDVEEFSSQDLDALHALMKCFEERYDIYKKG